MQHAEGWGNAKLCLYKYHCGLTWQRQYVRGHVVLNVLHVQHLLALADDGHPSPIASCDRQKEQTIPFDIIII